MHIKIAFYLDTLTRDTGALRLIPGSHLLGDSYADALNPVTAASRLPDFDTKEAGISGRDVPAVAIETVEGRGEWGAVTTAHHIAMYIYRSQQPPPTLH